MADVSLMSVAEFLKWDDGTDTRYELVYGRPVAMAFPDAIHGTIVASVGFAVHTRLSNPYRIAATVGLHLPDWGDCVYLADIAVTREAPRPGAHFMPSPVAVFEVLSEDTAERDLSIKLPDYQEMPSMQDIVVVSAQQRRVEHWRRDGERWVAQTIVGDGAVSLAALSVTIPLAEVYANVELEPREPA
jgi:Uma2 family endonuclease